MKRPLMSTHKVLAMLGCLLGATSFAAEVTYLNPGTVLPKTLPFSEAVRVGDILYLSGVVGNVPGTVTLVPGGITKESKQAIENLRANLAAQSLSLDNLVKCTVFLADIAEWAAFNDVYASYFKAGHFPARTASSSAGLAFRARVEIDCIAAYP